VNQPKPGLVAKGDFAGTTVIVALPKNCPAQEALRFGFSEWQGRTGGTVKYVESDGPDAAEAEIRVLDGAGLNGLESPLPVPKSVRDAPTMQFLDLPSPYRLRHAVRQGEVIGLPIAGEMMLLWYRHDLFTDPVHRKAYEAKEKKPLEPPKTWADYESLARYFAGSGAVPHGTAEPMDGSPDAVRVFEARAGSYAKSCEWYSFRFNVETGRCRYGTPGFVRALEDWKRIRSLTPARDGKAVSVAEAVKTFLDGRTAMVLSVAPIRLPAGDPAKMRGKLGVAELPGSLEVYPPPTAATPTEEARVRKEVNRTVHAGRVGWFVVPTKPSLSPAALSLMLTLTSKEDSIYVVNGARSGLIPIRTNLLTEAIRFEGGYGLPLRTCRELFTASLASLTNENWIADLMLPEELEVNKRLAAKLQEALAGTKPSATALAEATAEIDALLEPGRADFLRRLRLSLDLAVD
jgi:multiple sugar transport system substrate-binding protein